MKVKDIKLATVGDLKEGDEIRIRIKNGELEIYKRVPEETKSIWASKGDVKISNEKELEVSVTKLMKELGIPGHLKGYEYIRTAIKMVIEDPSLINAITTRLYPNVAKKYQTTSSRVERAIRTAIEVSWARASIQKTEEIFGYTVSEDKGRPTNCEYIAMLVDELRMKIL